MIDPLELIENGIPVYKAYQHPKDFICTFFKVKKWINERRIIVVFRRDTMLVKLLISCLPFPYSWW